MNTSSGIGMLVLGLWLAGTAACSSDSSDDTIEERATDTLQNDERIQMSDETDAQAGYAAEQEGQPDTHAASVHRTISFSADSAELDSAARQNLSAVAQALNGDLATQLILRTVNPNDVTGGDTTDLGEQRAQTVLQFLQEQGVEVEQVRVDRYSSREFESAQDTAALQDDVALANGTSELSDSEDLARSAAEQEVVITVVSSDAL